MAKNKDVFDIDNFNITIKEQIESAPDALFAVNNVYNEIKSLLDESSLSSRTTISDIQNEYTAVTNLMQSVQNALYTVQEKIKQQGELITNQKYVMFLNDNNNEDITHAMLGVLVTPLEAQYMSQIQNNIITSKMDIHTSKNIGDVNKAYNDLYDNYSIDAVLKKSKIKIANDEIKNFLLKHDLIYEQSGMFNFKALDILDRSSVRQNNDLSEQINSKKLEEINSNLKADIKALEIIKKYNNRNAVITELEQAQKNTKLGEDELQSLQIRYNLASTDKGIGWQAFLLITNKIIQNNKDSRISSSLRNPQDEQRLLNQYPTIAEVNKYVQEKIEKDIKEQQQWLYNVYIKPENVYDITLSSQLKTLQGLCIGDIKSVDKITKCIDKIIKYAKMNNVPISIKENLALHVLIQHHVQGLTSTEIERLVHNIAAARQCYANIQNSTYIQALKSVFNKPGQGIKEKEKEKEVVDNVDNIKEQIKQAQQKFNEALKKAESFYHKASTLLQKEQQNQEQQKYTQSIKTHLDNAKIDIESSVAKILKQAKPGDILPAPMKLDETNAEHRYRFDGPNAKEYNALVKSGLIDNPAEVSLTFTGLAKLLSGQPEVYHSTSPRLARGGAIGDAWHKFAELIESKNFEDHEDKFLLELEEYGQLTQQEQKESLNKFKLLHKCKPDDLDLIYKGFYGERLQPKNILSVWNDYKKIKKDKGLSIPETEKGYGLLVAYQDRRGNTRFCPVGGTLDAIFTDVLLDYKTQNTSIGQKEAMQLNIGRFAMSLVNKYGDDKGNVPTRLVIASVPINVQLPSDVKEATLLEAKVLTDEQIQSLINAAVRIHKYSPMDLKKIQDLGDKTEELMEHSVSYQTFHRPFTGEYTSITIDKVPLKQWLEKNDQHYILRVLQALEPADRQKVIQTILSTKKYGFTSDYKDYTYVQHRVEALDFLIQLEGQKIKKTKENLAIAKQNLKDNIDENTLAKLKAIIKNYETILSKAPQRIKALKLSKQKVVSLIASESQDNWNIISGNIADLNLQQSTYRADFIKTIDRIAPLTQEDVKILKQHSDDEYNIRYKQEEKEDPGCHEKHGNIRYLEGYSPDSPMAQKINAILGDEKIRRYAPKTVLYDFRIDGGLHHFLEEIKGKNVPSVVIDSIRKSDKKDADLDDVYNIVSIEGIPIKGYFDALENIYTKAEELQQYAINKTNEPINEKNYESVHEKIHNFWPDISKLIKVTRDINKIDIRVNKGISNYTPEQQQYIYAEYYYIITDWKNKIVQDMRNMFEAILYSYSDIGNNNKNAATEIAIARKTALAITRAVNSYDHGQEFIDINLQNSANKILDDGTTYYNQDPYEELAPDVFELADKADANGTNKYIFEDPKDINLQYLNNPTVIELAQKIQGLMTLASRYQKQLKPQYKLYKEECIKQHVDCLSEDNFTRYALAPNVLLTTQYTDSLALNKYIQTNFNKTWDNLNFEQLQEAIKGLFCHDIVPLYSTEASIIKRQCKYNLFANDGSMLLINKTNKDWTEYLYHWFSKAKILVQDKNKRINAIDYFNKYIKSKDDALDLTLTDLFQADTGAYTNKSGKINTQVAFWMFLGTLQQTGARTMVSTRFNKDITGNYTDILSGYGERKNAQLVNDIVALDGWGEALGLKIITSRNNKAEWYNVKLQSKFRTPINSNLGMLIQDIVKENPDDKQINDLEKFSLEEVYQFEPHRHSDVLDNITQIHTQLFKLNQALSKLRGKYKTSIDQRIYILQQLIGERLSIFNAFASQNKIVSDTTFKYFLTGQLPAKYNKGKLQAEVAAVISGDGEDLSDTLTIQQIELLQKFAGYATLSAKDREEVEQLLQRKDFRNDYAKLYKDTYGRALNQYKVDFKTIFAKYLDAIPDKEIRDYVEKILEHMPQYFAHVPASSTSKYHPDFADVEQGGLILHTMAATDILMHLMNGEYHQSWTEAAAEEQGLNECLIYFQNHAALSTKERALLIAAIMLHDMLKYGEEDRTNSNNAIDVAWWTQGITWGEAMNAKMRTAYTTHSHPQDAAKFILQFLQQFGEQATALGQLLYLLIASHSGQYTTSSYDNTVLPQPGEFNGSVLPGLFADTQSFTDLLSSMGMIIPGYDEYEFKQRIASLQRLVSLADFLASRNNIIELYGNLPGNQNKFWFLTKQGQITEEAIKIITDYDNIQTQIRKEAAKKMSEQIHNGKHGAAVDIDTTIAAQNEIKQLLEQTNSLLQQIAERQGLNLGSVKTMEAPIQSLNGVITDATSGLKAFESALTTTIPSIISTSQEAYKLAVETGAAARADIDAKTAVIKRTAMDEVGNDILINTEKNKLLKDWVNSKNPINQMLAETIQAKAYVQEYEFLQQQLDYLREPSNTLYSKNQQRTLKPAEAALYKEFLQDYLIKNFSKYSTAKSTIDNAEEKMQTDGKSFETAVINAGLGEMETAMLGSTATEERYNTLFDKFLPSVQAKLNRSSGVGKFLINIQKLTDEKNDLQAQKDAYKAIDKVKYDPEIIKLDQQIKDLNNTINQATKSLYEIYGATPEGQGVVVFDGNRYFINKDAWQIYDVRNPETDKIGKTQEDYKQIIHTREKHEAVNFNQKLKILKKYQDTQAKINKLEKEQAVYKRIQLECSKEYDNLNTGQLDLLNKIDKRHKNVTADLASENTTKIGLQEILKADGLMDEKGNLTDKGVAIAKKGKIDIDSTTDSTTPKKKGKSSKKGKDNTEDSIYTEFQLKYNKAAEEGGTKQGEVVKAIQLLAKWNEAKALVTQYTELLPSKPSDDDMGTQPKYVKQYWAEQEANNAQAILNAQVAQSKYTEALQGFTLDKDLANNFGLASMFEIASKQPKLTPLSTLDETKQKLTDEYTKSQQDLLKAQAKQQQHKNYINQLENKQGAYWKDVLENAQLTTKELDDQVKLLKKRNDELEDSLGSGAKALVLSSEERNNITTKVQREYSTKRESDQKKYNTIVNSFIKEAKEIEGYRQNIADRNRQNAADYRLTEEARKTNIELNKQDEATYEDKKKEFAERLKAQNFDTVTLNQITEGVNNTITKRAGQRATRRGGAQNILDTIGQGLKSRALRLIDYDLPYRVINKVMSAVRSLVSTINTLNKSMTNIQIVTGANVEKARNMMTAYAKLGQTIGSTTEEVANAANEWLRQGYSAEQANDLIRSSTALAKLGMIDSGQATEYLTSMLKGFKLEASQAMDVVSKLTSVDMSAAVSAGDIAKGLQKVATTADLAGVSLDKTVGYVSTISEITQQDTSSVGNALRTMMARFGNVKAGAYTSLMSDEEGDGSSTEYLNDIEKVLSQVGIRIRSTNSEFKSFETVIDELGEKWQSLDNVSQNAIATAMAGVRQRESFLVMMENIDRVNELSQVSADSAGVAESKYETYLNSMEAATNRLTAAWQEFALSIEQSGILITLKDILARAIKLIPTLLSTVSTLLAGGLMPKVVTFAAQLINSKVPAERGFKISKNIDKARSQQDEHGLSRNVQRVIRDKDGNLRAATSSEGHGLNKKWKDAEGKVIETKKRLGSFNEKSVEYYQEHSAETPLKLDSIVDLLTGIKSNTDPTGAAKAEESQTVGENIADSIQENVDENTESTAIEEVKATVEKQVESQENSDVIKVDTTETLQQATDKLEEATEEQADAAKEIADAVSTEDAQKSVQSVSGKQGRLKDIVDKVGGSKALMGAVGGGMSAILTGLTTYTTHQNTGGIIGPGNFGESQETSKTAKIVAGTTTAAVAGIATAFGGPIAGAIASAFTSALNKYLIGPLIDREQNRRAERVKEAQENLTQLNKIQTATDSTSRILEKSSLSGDDIQQIASYLDTLNYTNIINGDKSVNLLDAVLEELNQGKEEVDKITDLQSKLLDSDIDTRAQIINAIDSVIAKKTFEQIIASNEQKKLDIAAAKANARSFLSKSGQERANKILKQAAGDNDVNLEEKTTSELLTIYSRALAIARNNGQDSAAKKFATVISELRTAQTYESEIETNLSSQIVDVIKTQQLRTLKDTNEFTTTDLNELSTKTTNSYVTSLGDSIQTMSLGALSKKGLKQTYQDIITTILSDDELKANVRKAGYSVSEDSIYINKELGYLTSDWEELVKSVVSSSENGQKLLQGNVYTLNQLLKFYKQGAAKYGMDNDTLNTYLKDFAAAAGIDTTGKSIQDIVDHLSSMSGDLGELKTADIKALKEEKKQKVSDFQSILSEYISNGGKMTSSIIDTVLDTFADRTQKVLDSDEGIINLFDTFKAISQEYAIEQLAQIYQNSTYKNEWFTPDRKKRLKTDDRLDDEQVTQIENAASLQEVHQLLADWQKQKQLDDDTYKSLKIEFLNVTQTATAVVQSALQDSIDSLFNDTVQSYYETYYQRQIDALTEQKKMLQDINEQRKRELDLIEAKIKLENAQKDKKRVWREGVGWVYEADAMAIQEVQDQIDELENQKSIEDLEFEISILQDIHDSFAKISEDAEFEELSNAFNNWADLLGVVNSDQITLLQTFQSILSGQSSGLGNNTVVDMSTVQDRITGSGGGSGGTTPQASNPDLLSKAQAFYEAINTDSSKFDDSTLTNLESTRTAFSRLYNDATDDQKSEVQTILGDAKWNMLTTAQETKEAAISALTKTNITTIDGNQYYIIPESADNTGVAGDIGDSSTDTKKTSRPKIFKINSATLQGNGSFGYTRYYTSAYNANKAATNGTLENAHDHYTVPEDYAVILSSEDRDHSASKYGISDNYAGLIYTNGTAWSLVPVPTAATGSLGLPGGPTLINEKGTEGIITPQGTLTALPSGTGVVPADITSNLWKLGELAPNLVKENRTIAQAVSTNNFGNDESFNIDNLTVQMTATPGFDMNDFVNQLKAARQLTKHNY